MFLRAWVSFDCSVGGDGKGLVVVVAYVGGVARVGVLEGTRDEGGGPRVAAAAAGDGHLRARDVELRDAGRPGVVDGERLDAEQIVARRDARGDLAGVGTCGNGVGSVGVCEIGGSNTEENRTGHVPGCGAAVEGRAYGKGSG